ncbi:ras GEF [Panus rudis PR-1116 ss-1]|nr:ras GEF [Panus rudis PR-1116 ss-1]
MFHSGPSNKLVRGSKLIKVLGNDAPKFYIDTLNAHSKPWFLRPEYDLSEIKTDPDGTVRAGTIKALVERLTSHEHADSVYVRDFLMTFKSFMSVDDLFDRLVARFRLSPPEDMDALELDEWKKLKQHVVRARVLNVLKTMITDDTVLEEEDMHILTRIQDFLSDSDVSAFSAAKQLSETIQRMHGKKTPVKRSMAILSPPPSPIVPRSRKNMKLWDIDPLEVARQITLMEFIQYRQIRPSECLQRTRQQKPGNRVDSISTFIQFSNKVVNWVIETILSRSDPKKRATVVKHFIAIADKCRSLQNYSSVMAIISGLNNPAIRRLKLTWEQVGSRAMSQFESCETLMSPDRNFHNYWSVLRSSNPPAIPFFGCYLSTLTFINDGAEDNLTSNHPDSNSNLLINFRKRQKAAEVIQEIQRWQSPAFNFQPVAIVLAFIESNLRQYADDRIDHGERFYKLSLEREPRN